MTRLSTFIVFSCILLSGCAMSAPGGTAGSSPLTKSLQTRVNAQERMIEKLTLRLDGLEQQFANQQQQLDALQTSVSSQKVTHNGENTAFAGQPTAAAKEQAAESPTEKYSYSNKGE